MSPQGEQQSLTPNAYSRPSELHLHKGVAIGSMNTVVICTAVALQYNSELFMLKYSVAPRRTQSYSARRRRQRIGCASYCATALLLYHTSYTVIVSRFFANILYLVDRNSTHVSDISDVSDGYLKKTK